MAGFPVPHNTHLREWRVQVTTEQLQPPPDTSLLPQSSEKMVRAENGSEGRNIWRREVLPVCALCMAQCNPTDNSVRQIGRAL